MQIRQLHLGRGDEVEALGGVEEILLELRQLAVPVSVAALASAGTHHSL